MVQVQVTEEVGASADQVWGVIGDFGGAIRWGAPAMSSCEVEGEGIGAVRRMVGGGGLSLAERLQARDEAARTIRYELVEPHPLPLAGYVAEIAVHDAGGGRARIVWSGTFEPRGAPQEVAEGLLRHVYENGIAGVRRALGVGT